MTTSKILFSEIYSVNYISNRDLTIYKIIFLIFLFLAEDGPVTNAADIWAYGLVLWEMIALVPPHVRGLDDESTDESITNAADRRLDDSNNTDENITFLEEIMHMHNTYGK